MTLIWICVKALLTLAFVGVLIWGYHVLCELVDDVFAVDRDDRIYHKSFVQELIDISKKLLITSAAAAGAILLAPFGLLGSAVAPLMVTKQDLADLGLTWRGESPIA